MQFRRLAVSMTAIVALASGAFLYASHPARGSDHQDSPAVVSQPGADITDVYVFPSPRNSSYVDLAMDIHPLIPAGMKNVSLDPSVLYQFKVSHGPLGSTAPADAALQVVASGTGPKQTLTLYGKRGAALTDPSTLGPALGSFPLNGHGGKELGAGVIAYAGLRADPFFFDLFQFFKILPDRNYSNPRTGNMLGTMKPTFNGFPAGSTSGPNAGNYPCSTAPSTNALAQLNGGFNVISIVLEVPKKLFVLKGQSPIVHVWATTSRPLRQHVNGQVAFGQIELLSRPAVKELFEVFADHAKTNVAEPYNDPAIKYAISNFMTNVAGRSPAISNVVSAVLYPNEIAADISQPGPAAYLGVETGGATGGKFGGRGLTDDVIDTSLSVVFGNTIPALGLAPDDHKENACLVNEHVKDGQGGGAPVPYYPYVGEPH